MTTRTTAPLSGPDARGDYWTPGHTVRVQRLWRDDDARFVYVVTDMASQRRQECGSTGEAEDVAETYLYEQAKTPAGNGAAR